MELSKYLPLPEMEREFEEFKKLKTVEEKKAFQEKRKAMFENKTPAEQQEYTAATKAGLKSAIDRCEEIIEKVELGEVANIVSVSYIAQKYFGRTRHWLYQRLKGSLVNGKPARFTAEEKKKLQEALRDISNIIKDTSLKIA